MGREEYFSARDLKILCSLGSCGNSSVERQFDAKVFVQAIGPADLHIQELFRRPVASSVCPILLGKHPLLDVYRCSLSVSCAKRPVLMSTKWFAAMMLSIVFHTTEATSWGSPELCKRGSLEEHFSRMIAIGIMSEICVRLPMHFAGSLHRRKFVFAEEWTDDRQRRVRRMWWLKCMFFYFLTA